MMAKRLIATLGLCSALALAFLVQPGPAHAQLTRGVISGTVTDTSGAAVPGATATARNLDTNIVRTATTNTAGFYRLPALEPGRYSVLIEMPGFSSAENKDIRVQTSQEVTFDVGIKVSTITETVDVTSESAAVLLNKSNPTIGYTATARQAVDLPLSAARDVNNPALLSPNTFQAPGSTGISANGNRARNNNFTIDGSDNNDISVTISTTPVIPEAVAEFQNQTNAYNAEFGRNSGAQLNVITRSGTNQFHGDVFEYYRGSTLNSRDNLEKAAGRTDPTRENRNQAGFALGGPIVGDRTFFFVLGQIDRTRAGGTQGATITLPTQTGFAALRGVPLRDGQSAASRQAVLDNLGFLTDVYSQNLLFRNVRTTLVNGVPIEIGQINVPRSQPDDRVNVVAHRFVVNYIWEVPLFNNSRNGVLRSVLGGWQIAGVTQAQSGQPFTIFTGVDSNGNGTAGGDRANVVPGCSPLPDPDTGNFRTFLPSDCFLVPRGTNGLPLANSLGNGNLPRNTFRAAPFWNTDLSLSKKFRISDDAVTLRADFLNVFNQDEYGLPVANMSGVSFGQNLRDWGQRSITLGLKYSF